MDLLLQGFKFSNCGLRLLSFGVGLCGLAVTFILSENTFELFKFVDLVVVLLHLVFEAFDFVCRGFDLGPCFFQHLFFAAGLLRVILIVVLLYGCQQFATPFATGHLSDFSLNRFMKRVARIPVEFQWFEGSALLDP